MNPNLTPAEAEADIAARLDSIVTLEEQRRLTEEYSRSLTKWPSARAADDLTLRVGLVVAFDHYTVKVLSFGATLVNIKAMREGYKTQRLSVPLGEFEAMLAKRKAEVAR